MHHHPAPHYFLFSLGPRGQTRALCTCVVPLHSLPGPVFIVNTFLEERGWDITEPFHHPWNCLWWWGSHPGSTPARHVHYPLSQLPGCWLLSNGYFWGSRCERSVLATSKKYESSTACSSPRFHSDCSQSCPVFATVPSPVFLRGRSVCSLKGEWLGHPHLKESLWVKKTYVLRTVM